MKDNPAQATLPPIPRMMVARCTKAFKLLAHLAIVSILLLLAGPAWAAATGAKQKEYPQDFETVWTAAMGALQGHGYPIIYSDKPSGTITTDYKVDEEDTEWHHKFNLLLVRNGEEATNISVTCTFEKRSDRGLAWEDVASDGSHETKLLAAIARRLQPGGVAVDNADMNCRANFSIKGSVVRGTTYASFEEFQALAQAPAIDALVSSISRESLALLSSDKSTGTVSATGQSAGGRSYGLDFAVVPVSGGVRVSVVRKLHPGDRGHDDAVRDQFCKIISGVAEAMPKPAPRPAKANSPSIAVPADNTPIEDRLRKLDELYKKGLITEDEYKKKRAELLSRI